ncbi:MAG: DMT family transporter [Candidatus Diapherotrites archaeon]|nr:DMT family transporter [Candidatus Diapherotrites archaeon]
MNQRKGLLLVLLTAVVSGASVFVNSFAVKESNPAVFTFLKSAVVAVLLLSAILLFKDFKSLRSLSKKRWAQLAAIGLIGGSIPFLLFFYALQMTSAVNAGFLHKTLFIWSALLAAFFLREKISKSYAVAALLLLAGNFLFFNISSFGLPEALVLAATILWAAENTLSKHVLRGLSGSAVAFGRMFFGALFVLAFLALTGQATEILSITTVQLQWALVSSAFLFAYVFTWYSGLRELPLHKAAAVLLLAQPLTVFLSFAFSGKPFGIAQAGGFLLIAAGVFIAVAWGYFLQATGNKAPFISARRN